MDGMTTRVPDWTYEEMISRGRDYQKDYQKGRARDTTRFGLFFSLTKDTLNVNN